MIARDIVVVEMENTTRRNIMAQLYASLVENRLLHMSYAFRHPGQGLALMMQSNRTIHFRLYLSHMLLSHQEIRGV